MIKQNRAFTLIELIVSIAIIAILTVVTLVSYGGVNKKARDSRRMADLQKIAIGLEMAKQVGATYPATLDMLKPNFMQSIPDDPKSGFLYYYSRLTNYTYTLDAYVEDLGSTTGIYESCGAATCNYRITNP